jgi:hypothetical protein
MTWYARSLVHGYPRSAKGRLVNAPPRSIPGSPKPQGPSPADGQASASLGKVLPCDDGQVAKPHVWPNTSSSGRNMEQRSRGSGPRRTGASKGVVVVSGVEEVEAKKGSSLPELIDSRQDGRNVVEAGNSGVTYWQLSFPHAFLAQLASSRLIADTNSRNGPNSTCSGVANSIA